MENEPVKVKMQLRAARPSVQGAAPASPSAAAAVEAVEERCGGRCAIFAGDDAAGWKYALRLPEGADLKAFVGAMNAALGGRGGGRDGFAQGGVAADRAAIEAWFAGM